MGSSLLIREFGLTPPIQGKPRYFDCHRGIPILCCGVYQFSWKNEVEPSDDLQSSKKGI